MFSLVFTLVWTHKTWVLAEFTPAELYFQMGLLAKISAMSNFNPTQLLDTQSPRIWFRKAVHINPSCARYWTMVTQTGTNNLTMLQS